MIPLSPFAYRSMYDIETGDYPNKMRRDKLRIDYRVLAYIFWAVMALLVILVIGWIFKHN